MYVVVISLVILAAVSIGSAYALENVTLDEFMISYPEDWNMVNDSSEIYQGINLYPLEDEYPRLDVIVNYLSYEPIYKNNSNYKIAGLPASYGSSFVGGLQDHHMLTVNMETGNQLNVILTAKPYSHEKYIPLWKNLIGNITINSTN